MTDTAHFDNPPTTHPLVVRGDLGTPPGRWLWLVKWVLAIPHYIVLFFLWIAFLVVTVIAFFAILFTGRYPRSLFDFAVGVLRWNWRVSFYSYGVLGTDRYPPFTLGDVPDYPAGLQLSYPETLSRGLVLVKWWLLAIPHYLVLAAFSGGAYFAVRSTQYDDRPDAIGVIGALLLIVGFGLLFTGRYLPGVFDFVMGIQRWVLRVGCYTALLTDVYPPFRLDQGGSEPSTPPPAPRGPDFVAASQEAQPATGPEPGRETFG
ncbi:DUF4389 domain-containing protein [Microlunatus sp. Gsoil 973]|uniref:DUF4389 domain-containing protein n=1 Tax=Microlunatus sp. Gsoil 973 TaxID=2672569 RepID=UPI0012B4DE28|nr:DUF4389 domain-containing protein [Microlunatus sp. Gsoil 973]QGN32685.1 DUF4389 domain-containing protein [Microlunatus sp. Gsoil 973]